MFVMLKSLNHDANLRCLLGLVRTETDGEETKVHNAALPDHVQNSLRLER